MHIYTQQKILVRQEVCFQNRSGFKKIAFALLTSKADKSKRRLLADGTKASKKHAPAACPDPSWASKEVRIGSTSASFSQSLVVRLGMIIMDDEGGGWENKTSIF